MFIYLRYGNREIQFKQYIPGEARVTEVIVDPKNERIEVSKIVKGVWYGGWKTIKWSGYWDHISALYNKHGLGRWAIRVDENDRPEITGPINEK